MSEPINRHNALVTGGAHRVGRALVEAVAEAGAGVVVHYGSSSSAAESLVATLRDAGRRAVAIGADLADAEAAAGLLQQAETAIGPIDWLVNSASIFEALDLDDTSAAAWDRHFAINLRAPFLLTQAFARSRAGRQGAVLNILDWRALRPGADHLPYTIAKAGLAALTQSLAVGLAPAIRVNALALGAILPPSDGGGAAAVKDVPAARWGRLAEVGHAARFLLDGPGYITGAIVHLDGGRHLV